MIKRKEKKTSKSVKISTMKLKELADGKKRHLRLGFTKYLCERYGLNLNTAYGKMRRGLYHPWEVMGVLRCMQEYLPEYTGDPERFFESLNDKRDFVLFMSRMGMGEYSVRTKFPGLRFSELEKKGIREVYEEFLDEMLRSGEEEDHES